MQKRIAAIEVLADQVGGVISEAEAKTLILRKHHDLVAERLERYLSAEKHLLIQVFDRLWEKYAFSMRDIAENRQDTSRQLEEYLTGLNYVP